MIKLLNGDCLEEMDKLIVQGVKVDAIITDPPYGTTACKWDSVIPFDEMWERLKALRKERTPIVLFGSEPFSSALRMSNIKNYKYDWVWDKKKPSTGLHSKIMPLKKTENIIVFNKHFYYPVMEKQDSPRTDKPRVANNGEAFGGKEVLRQHSNNGYKYPKNIIEISNASQKGKVHPTQKPAALMEYIIKTYTNENELVLDFTMGSGTTGLACKNLNRDFIGIEKDEKYFKIATERIK